MTGYVCQTCGRPVEFVSSRGLWRHVTDTYAQGPAFYDHDAVVLEDDEEPDRAPSSEQEQAWNEQYNGTSLGS